MEYKLEMARGYVKKGEEARLNKQPIVVIIIIVVLVLVIIIIVVVTIFKKVRRSG